MPSFVFVSMHHIESKNPDRGNPAEKLGPEWKPTWHHGTRRQNLQGFSKNFQDEQDSRGCYPIYLCITDKVSVAGHP